ncbi:zinc-binding dehydrogenase [Actinoplanes solisilvae]|uniref:zinc-binding dehydrogenase n=1 Tax=Actinoplanes solisilvae TaxID=2486853 RepID=UPI000FD92CAA|nr:alcohol dehydrogenase catalytic domain-containing protein [Actinoplanes solisilvae]
MPTYLAIHVDSDGTLRPTARELTPPGAGDVRIQVLACGVCHSDSLAVHPYGHGEPTPAPGHEAVGVIDALGEGVTGWAIGTRVGVGFLAGHCGTCANCRRGDFVGCTNQQWTGVHKDGGYAEVLYARASSLVTIPDELTSEEAAPLLCAGFTVYNALMRSGARPGDLVAIQGIGGLGHLGLQYARAMGLRVAAIARGSAKATLAKELGADYYIDSSLTDVAAELQQLGGAAAVIATAANSNMTPLIGGLARGGKLVAVGITEQPIEVSTVTLIMQDVEIVGSLTGTPAENEQNLRFAAAQGIRALTELAPLTDAAEAYDRMMSGDARFRMVLTTQ